MRARYAPSKATINTAAIGKTTRSQVLLLQQSAPLEAPPARVEVRHDCPVGTWKKLEAPIADAANDRFPSQGCRLPATRAAR